MTTNNDLISEAGRPIHTRFCRASGRPYIRPQGMASAQDYFSNNYSLGVKGICKFNKCRKQNCKIKCKDNNLVLEIIYRI